MAEVNGPKIYTYLFGNQNLPITETMVNYWIVMAFILFLCIFLTSRMEKVPKGKQAIAEKIVLMIDNLVDQNMGPDSRIYSPYIATLMMSSVFGSLCSLFTLRSVTADLNTTLGWALITFAMITYTKIKYGGLGGYLKSFTEPIFVMVPLNILSEIATPVSMSFRHFGNIAGGFVITTLMLGALGGLSSLLHLPIPLLQIGIPGITSLYFDLFSGCIQAFIFSMLTMAYVGSAKE
ncbi:MAG: F0F1 ATP synthase subunit A [Clostridiaceae bacterium]|jgi:F-type H+-transporting ATPase subunit a|nr:F0F1 ATP synthase subunit A [Butyricicoccus pullicaecorum]MBS7224718.1 F0F1 ATP synthase subunit A [Clostridiaceae bacterium]